jgi:regulation of enolase protein 1 (concanavalin A-like superfamily)
MYPHDNMNAPRMMLELRGDFAVETRVVTTWEDQAHWFTGLLFWKDASSFVRFEKSGGYDHLLRGEIHLWASVHGRYEHFGRGRLRGSAFTLRLERHGDRVAAFCKADEGPWMTCGHVIFPVDDPLLVGVAALQSAVAHFDYVRVLTKESAPAQ